MPECQHQWDMINIQFGKIIFEKCSHCNSLRSSFAVGDDPVPEEKYHEGECSWSRVEHAQSFRFDLQCKKCNQIEKYDELMGFMFCTGCMDDCRVEMLQRQFEPQRTSLLVAFGFLPDAKTHPIPKEKLDTLTDYFNQRRDTSRSRIKIIAFNLIDDPSLCKGIFIHDAGMLPLHVMEDRNPIF